MRSQNDKATWSILRFDHCTFTAQLARMQKVKPVTEIPDKYIYIDVMAAVSYTIRVLPLTLIRKPIKNQFIQSFLYYVPYATLAVMTFPAIIHATQTPISGLVALIAGIIAAWLGAGLFPVSVICCVLVFVIELFV